MNEFHLILIPGLAAVTAWLAGQGLCRWSPGWRHAPWLLLTAAGCGLLWIAARQDPGSTMGSGFAFVANLMVGGLLTAGGLVAGVLTWLFPGTVQSRFCPAPSRTAAPGSQIIPQEDPPPTFTLLRHSLEQEIPVYALIQAAQSVSSIQEADCRMIHPRAGILFQNLEKADAIRLRSTLKAQNHPVHLVEQNHLFALPTGRRAQSLRLEEDALVETDCVGREHRHPLPRTNWYSAGRVEDRVYQEEVKIKTRVNRDMRGHAKVETYREKTRGTEELTSLCLEILVPNDPGRIIWTCDQHQRRLLQNRPVGPGDSGTFEAFLMELRGRIPPEKLNPAIRHIGQQPLWVYPSRKAFEDEIRWAGTCMEVLKQEQTS